MSEGQVPGRLVEQLRSNLRAAGISVGEADLDGMLANEFLRVPMALEGILARYAADIVPDYLKIWGDRVESDPAKPSGTTAVKLSKPVSNQAKSIAEVAPRLKAGEVSPVELTEQALNRIAERDPLLNAFQLVLGERAMEAARRAEQEIAAGQYRGPLHGVPIAVKDLLAMRGTRTTAGSKILGDWVTDFDSAGVERLETAGAIIVGKTRMSEFAYSPGSNNAHYGTTRNPHNLDYDTGGSSSGSGSAVADGMVFAALGTDTGGSIRIPAAQCGLVGLKPTFGRVSLYGGVTLAWSLDHLGPMTNTVADAALMLEVLAGYDARDPRTRQQPLTGLDRLEAGVKGMRIGVLGENGTGQPLATPEALAAWRSGLETLARNGAELIPLDLPEINDLWMLNGALIGIEAATYHEPMLRERLSDFGEFMRQRVLAAYAYGPTTFVRIQQIRINLRRYFDSLFDKIDLLSTPTMPSAAPLLGTPASTMFTGPFNLLGWPAITVPVGKTAAENLPLGLQLIGKPWDEATVLQAARVIEAETSVMA